MLVGDDKCTINNVLAVAGHCSQVFDVELNLSETLLEVCQLGLLVSRLTSNIVIISLHKVARLLNKLEY